jgi:hypothetical protein
MPNKQPVKPETAAYLSQKSFLIEAPLYYDFDLTVETTADSIFEWLAFSSTVDAYCITCGKASVFTCHPDPFFKTFTSIIVPSPYETWRKNKEANRLYQTIFTCTRTQHEAYVVFYLKQSDSIQKIGQFPSVADLQKPETAKYRKLLGQEQYKEFTRALGLAAHGVGIGSFVYLRRIFENLIEEAHTAAQQDHGFDEDKYKRARMDEKIEMLSHRLPSFLIENKSIYGILSKGIHELTEAECLSWFGAVRLGIELILDEKSEQAEKRKKVQQAQAEIRKISQQIKS